MIESGKGLGRGSGRRLYSKYLVYMNEIINK